jgi:Lrp/AsnC family leucine-responsive transcriptional regulator
MVSNNIKQVEIDEIDRHILELLQEDGKITINKIAEKVSEKLGLKKPKSATAIRARVQKLEEVLIKKYVALIDCRHLGYREMVMASLRVNSQEPIEKVKTEIEKIDKIKYGYVVTGEYPLFIMAKCLDHEDSMRLIDQLRNLPGVEEVKTQVVLDRIKEDTTIIIPDVFSKEVRDQLSALNLSNDKLTEVKKELAYLSDEKKKVFLKELAK